MERHLYNQFLDVDPNDPNHVFVGLEEVYKTEDGGAHWTSIGPYWNFDFAAGRRSRARNSCPMTTHPDQHSIAFDNGRVYVANDGGLYRRPLRGETNANGNATDRENLNPNIRTLQYYSVAVGMVPGVVAVSGGLQDNGGSTWSRLGGNLPYTSALDVHLGPDNRIYAATHGRGIGRSQSRKRTTLSGLPCDRIPTPLHGCGGWMKICVQNWSGTIVAFSPVKEP